MAARPIEQIRTGEDLEPGLVLDHELLHELLIEPVQVVERVQHRVAAAHAQKEGDLAKTRLQIDDQGGALLDLRDLDSAIHGERGRAGAALGAEEHHRRGMRGSGRGRGAAHGCSPQRFVERLGRRRPREELVGPGSHRLNDQVGVDRGSDREDAGVRPAPAQLLDGRHRLCVARANVDDHHVRHTGLCRVLVDETSRHGARPEAPCKAGDKFFVVADDQCVELRHSYLPLSAGAAIARIAWRAQPDMPLPWHAAARTPRQSPAAAPEQPGLTLGLLGLLFSSASRFFASSAACLSALAFSLAACGVALGLFLRLLLGQLAFALALLTLHLVDALLLGSIGLLRRPPCRLLHRSCCSAARWTARPARRRRAAARRSSAAAARAACSLASSVLPASFTAVAAGAAVISLRPRLRRERRRLRRLRLSLGDRRHERLRRARQRVGHAR